MPSASLARRLARERDQRRAAPAHRPRRGGCDGPGWRGRSRRARARGPRPGGSRGARRAPRATSPCQSTACCGAESRGAARSAVWSRRTIAMLGAVAVLGLTTAGVDGAVPRDCDGAGVRARSPRRASSPPRRPSPAPRRAPRSAASRRCGRRRASCRRRSRCLLRVDRGGVLLGVVAALATALRFALPSRPAPMKLPSVPGAAMITCTLSESLSAIVFWISSGWRVMSAPSRPICSAFDLPTLSRR